ncbi:cysteine protease atg4b-like protein, partial [Lasius niger]
MTLTPLEVKVNVKVNRKSFGTGCVKCFFCATEKEFKSLCKSMQEELILPEKQPLFELCRERLTQWSPADVASEAIAAAS